MLPILIQNEFTRLRSVLFGTAQSSGPIPLAEDCYDPSSLRHVISGTYPTEVDMSTEIAAVLAVFDKYDIQVFQPTVIDNCNQIFTRDIAFVIEDKLIKSNILPDRDQEINALDSLFKQISPENNIVLPEDCHIEGGDVVLYDARSRMGMHQDFDVIRREHVIAVVG